MLGLVVLVREEQGSMPDDAGAIKMEADQEKVAAFITRRNVRHKAGVNSSTAAGKNDRWLFESLQLL